jgi:spore maturation protein CgeB
MKILYLGDIRYGTTSLQRCEALKSLGHQVDTVQIFPKHQNYLERILNKLYRLGFNVLGFDSKEINDEIYKKGSKRKYDILWIDKGVYVKAQSIEKIKEVNQDIKVIGYSPDYMELRHNNSRQFIEHSYLYDLFVTTKSYAVKWHKIIGCRNVLFQDNGFDPNLHKPQELSDREKILLGGPVGFIGSYEKDRWQYIEYLCKRGIPVKIYGNGWEKIRKTENMIVVGKERFGKDYSKLICSFDINLCFLRKINKDLQTTRSIEIPACAAFLMAERTKEHLALFKENKEAVYFKNKKELLKKCLFYMDNVRLRNKIALAGFERCQNSGYSYKHRMKQILDLIQGVS